jgi:hypothetical protein
MSLTMPPQSDVKDPIPVETSSQSRPLKREAAGPMATIQDDDERLLAEIGYEQV